MSTTNKTNPMDTFASASRMLVALRERQISAVELLELHLQQIERYNPQLNAIVTPDYENARLVAAQADAAQARGEDKPLLGLPLTIKDCIYVEGLPTTGGIAERAQAMAEADARLTARARAAGGVIMGKTNVPPYAADWQTDNPIFGRSNNPWDLARTPGGSTGGGAAAVAAGLTPLEFGGDFGGSIRIPAAFCGIYGHKPSETALARSGHFPGPNFPNAAAGMAVQGPLARSAEDLELALDVVAGPDVGEDVAWRLELPPARHRRLADYRVAILPPIEWQIVDNEIVAALDRLATELGRAGARVKEAQPELFGDLRDHYKLYLAIFWALTGTGQSEAERRRQAEDFRASDDEFVQSYSRGLEASASDYIIWFGQREQYRAAYRAFFRDWDVLLAPANIVNAFPHTREWRLEINGQMASYDRQFVYPSLANLTGQPATAFPVGLTQGGLPIGLQAIGPYLEDRTSIHFAGLVAQEFGGFRPPPGYDN
jgi:amidase